MASHCKTLEAKLRNAEWRRNKYWSNPEFREKEKAKSREYQRKKREREKQLKEKNYDKNLKIMRNEDYKDERWLKRANEIRRLDGYKCAMCGKSDVELHVHHLAYPPKPFHIWDATDDELVTLCKDCHMEIHNCEERPKLTEDRMLKVWNSDKCFRCMYWVQWSLLEGWERDAFYLDGGCRRLEGKGCIFSEVKNCDGCAFKSDRYESCGKSNIRCPKWTQPQCRYCLYFEPYDEHEFDKGGSVKGWCSAEGTDDISGDDFCEACCSKAFHPRWDNKMELERFQSYMQKKNNNHD